MSAVLVFALQAAFAQSTDSGAKQDMKDAGHETKQAAKDTGRATKKAAKKTGHTVKKGTHKAAHKTEQGAQKVEDKTKDLDNAQAKGTYDVAMAKADGNHDSDHCPRCADAIQNTQFPERGQNAANDRAREVHKKAGLRTPYWDWTDREGEQHYQKYAGTPPEHLLFGLRQALDMLFAEGLDNVHRRHRLLAEAVRRAIGVWSEGQAIGFNIIEPNERSDSVTCVLTNGHDPEALRAYCNKMCGVILGHGIGELSGKAFRVAHMGHVNAPMVLGTLGVIEMSLAALNIPHAKGGAQAAIDWLSAEVKA